MKKLLTLLVITVACLAACKKDDTSTEIKQYINGLTTLPASAVANPNAVVTNIISGTLRIKLAADSIDTDNILIGFSAGTKTSYVPNEDARTMQGFGLVSLSSMSSDNIPLSINELPLPTQSLTIALKVGAKKDGVYNLSMSAVKALPAIFEILLVDNYKKDSIDFKSNSNYAFNLYKADTTSYGSHRFSLLIRQNKALDVQLLHFTADKTTAGTQVTWKTENEFNYTSFSIERSTDNGQTFNSLTSLTSSWAGTYSFFDKATVKGTDQYRLKLQDLNGSVTYSSPVSIAY